MELVKVTSANAAHTIPAVMGLIRDLAIYERSLESVEATEDLLRQNLLGENKDGRSYAECMLAYVGGPPGQGEAVGMALYFFTFSTWTGKGGVYLEDFFVKESHRKQGIGKALFRHLGQLCAERGLPRLDWVVLDWNEDAKKVYRKMGAYYKEEWQGFRLEGDALAKLAG